MVCIFHHSLPRHRNSNLTQNPTCTPKPLLNPNPNPNTQPWQPAPHPKPPTPNPTLINLIPTLQMTPKSNAPNTSPKP